MVLEPLAAVSLAAAIVQFVGYSHQILSTGNALYKSTDGTLKDNAVLELVIKDFEDLLDRIRRAPPPNSAAFQKFYDESLELAREISDGLQKLKVHGTPDTGKSLMKAMKCVYRKERINKW